MTRTSVGGLTVALLLFAVHGVAATQDVDEYGLATTLLNQWPILHAHDAASTYLEASIFNKVKFNWVITQPKGGVEALLDCGARGLDWRPQINDGQLQMHHGPVTIPFSMATAMASLVAWAKKHPLPEDLVFVNVNDCDGGKAGQAACLQMSRDVLLAAGVPKSGIVEDCSLMKGLTVEKALNMSKLENGGHIFVVFGCVEENFLKEVQCVGYLSGSEDLMPDAAAPLHSRRLRAAQGIIPQFYGCWQDDKTKKFPLDRMEAYLMNVTRNGADPPSGYMWQIQALWQQSTLSAGLGILKLSSHLNDEEKSKLNAMTLDKLKGGFFPSVNLLEVNNVCNGGVQLLQALRDWQKAAAHGLE